MMNSENYSGELSLFRKLKRGNREPIKYFFEAYYADLCNFVNQFIRNETQSEEIVQDIFVYLWDNRQRISITTSVRSYLYAAARNKVLNHIRSEKNRAKLLDQLAKRDVYPSAQPDQITYENQLNEVVEKAVDDLPTQCRKVYTLSRERGYSNKEISKEMNISVKTVENQITIALRKLRESISINGF